MKLRLWPFRKLFSREHGGTSKRTETAVAGYVCLTQSPNDGYFSQMVMVRPYSPSITPLLLVYVVISVSIRPFAEKIVVDVLMSLPSLRINVVNSGVPSFGMHDVVTIDPRGANG